MKYYLSCTNCGKKYDSGYVAQTCNTCHSLLEVIYNNKIVHNPAGFKNFWDNEAVLPAGNYKHYELGATKLIGDSINEHMSLKLESTNPTGSFKDRGSVIEVGKAVEYGYKEMVCASTGNIGISLSYYSKLAGLNLVVFISKGAVPGKLRILQNYKHVRMVKIDGTFSDAIELAEKYARKHRSFLSGNYCYRKEGQKTIGYEIIAQRRDVTHIFMPTGLGALLTDGVYKALAEMKEAKVISRMPKLIAADYGDSKDLVSKLHLKNSTAKLTANQVYGLKALKSTRGDAVSINKKDMEIEASRFYKAHGIVAELIAVSGLACSRKYGLSKADRSVSVITGRNV